MKLITFNLSLINQGAFFASGFPPKKIFHQQPHLSRFYFFLIFFFSVCQSCISQVVFTETFGTSVTRLTSASMPSGTYAFANPTGTNNQKTIENGYYAVIDPTRIRDAWPVPMWWWWTGPQPTGNTGGGAGNPATNDHTTGDANGCVLVVNAGLTQHGFYQRTVAVTHGASYRFSLWFYLVNSGAAFDMQVRDVSTNSILATYSSGYISTEDTWTQYRFDFAVPVNCTSNTATGNIGLFIKNSYASDYGNDYYIDDIQLERITAGAEAPIICPANVLPLSLTAFQCQKTTEGTVSINWSTELETGIEQYEVERSVDGRIFNSIKTTAAENKSQASYKFTDYVPVAGNDKFYYRLKIAEQSGKISYSKIVLVTMRNNVPSLSVYPQPSVNGTVTVEWTGYDAPFDVILFQASGVKVKSYYNYSGNTIQFTQLNKGLYFVQIHSKKSGIVLNRKIIVGN
jgi:hypothetical protein